jgi:hypothetical protein
MNSRIVLLAAMIHRSLAHPALCAWERPDGRFSLCSTVVSDVIELVVLCRLAIFDTGESMCVSF